jgi:hypothetical protein
MPATIKYGTYSYANGQSGIDYCTFQINDTDLESSLLGFHLDYDISKPGRWHIESGAQLHCLKFASSSKVTSRRGIFYLVLNCVDEDNRVFERIGLYEDGASEEFPDGRYEDLAQEVTIRIV